MKGSRNPVSGDFLIVGGRRSGKSTKIVEFACRSLRNLNQDKGVVVSPTAQMSRHLWEQTISIYNPVEINRAYRKLTILFEGDYFFIYFLPFEKSIRDIHVSRLKLPHYYDELLQILKEVLPEFTGGAMTIPLIKLDPVKDEGWYNTLKENLGEYRFKQEFLCEFEED